MDQLPLFLSAQYKDILENYKYSRTPRPKEGEETTKSAEKKQARSSRLYKSRWIQAKLEEQQEKKKARRKNPDKDGDKTKKEEPKEKPKEKETKKKKKDEDQVDLEDVIERLKEEIYVKDQEFQDMREELEQLRKETEFMRGAYKEEKYQRQTLEANKQKIMMLKELAENSGKIEKKSYLDEKREQKKDFNTNDNLMAQVLQQQKNSQKAALAKKYADKWLDKVHERKMEREHDEFYHGF